MPHIFMSYSRQDSEIVDRICAALRVATLDVWRDREDIQGGDLWRRQLVEAISTCSTFVIVLSPNAIASANVRKELDIAEHRGKTILPIMISHTTIPQDMEYQLSGIQIVDISSNLDAGLSRLINSLISLSQATTPRSVIPATVKSAPFPATIRLFRFNERGCSGGEGGEYGVWIDNKKVATIRYGKELNFSMPAGNHEIYVKWGGIKSNVFTFKSDAGAQVSIICGEKKGRFFRALYVDHFDKASS